MAIFGEAEYIIGGKDNLSPIISAAEEKLRSLGEGVREATKALEALKAAQPPETSKGPQAAAVKAQEIAIESTSAATQRLEAQLRKVAEAQKAAFTVVPLDHFQRKTAELIQATDHRLAPALLKVGENTRRAYGDSTNLANALQRLQLPGAVAQQFVHVGNEIKANILLIQNLQKEINKINQTPGVGGTQLGKTLVGDLRTQINDAQQKLVPFGGRISSTSRLVSGFESTMGKATAGLARFGLTTSDAAILLGAGFAGGVAGAIQVGIKLIETLKEMAKAVFNFAKEAAFLADDLQSVRTSIDATFGEAGEAVKEFANVVPLAFGVARAETLRFLDTTGKLFTSFGVSEEVAARFSINLVGVADALRRGAGAGKTFEEAMKAVQDTVSGNLESLRDFGLTILQPDLDKVAKEVGIATGSYDSFTRSQLALILVLREAKRRMEETAVAPRTLKDAFNGARAEFQSVTEDLGNELIPAFQALGNVLTGIVITFRTAVLGAKAITEGFKDLVEDVPIIGKAFEFLGHVLQNLLPALKAAVVVLTALGKVGKEAREEARKDAEAFFDFDQAISDSVDNLKNRQAALGLTIEQLTQLRDAMQRLDRAIADGERNVADAELALARAREDSARDTADAQRDLSDAYRERNEKIGDANRELHEVEQDNLKRLADAKEKLKEAHLDAGRSIRDAEERLTEARIESAQRVEDAEEALAEARQDRLDKLLDAQLSLLKAQLQGDTFAQNEARLALSRATQNDRLEDAEEKLDEAKRERKKQIADLERDLAEARVDALDNIQDAEENLQEVREENARRYEDAQRKLQRTIEDTNRAIQDAQQKLAETEIDNNRRLFDSRQRLEDAQAKAIQNIADATQAVDDLHDKFGGVDLTLSQILDKIEALRTGIALLQQDIFEFDLPFSPGFVDPASPRQHGGPFHAGQRLLVGEAGPEVVQFDRAGEVIPNHALGGNVSITVNEVANDPEATAFAVWAKTLAGVNA